MQKDREAYSRSGQQYLSGIVAWLCTKPIHHPRDSLKEQEWHGEKAIQKEEAL